MTDGGWNCLVGVVCRLAIGGCTVVVGEAGTNIGTSFEIACCCSTGGAVNKEEAAEMLLLLTSLDLF